MKTLLLACALLVSLPAMAADGWNQNWNTQNWNTQNWNAWKNRDTQPDQHWGSRQQQSDFLQRRQNQAQEYQRQWGYDQRNRGYSQQSQPDRYRAYDYGNRSNDYRTP